MYSCIEMICIDSNIINLTAETSFAAEMIDGSLEMDG